jgi:ElaB/YqjD/DUF883 family membrane-anchored ribosome-binding protein
MAVEMLEKQAAAVEDILREVSRIKTVVTEAVDDGVQSALRAVKQGRDAADDAIHDARYAIKRKPFQSIGIVFAAGIALGSLCTLFTARRS